MNRASGVGNVWPLIATGWPSSKRTLTISGFTGTSSRQEATPMMGFTIETPL